jgi:hypothetical protein
MQVFCPDCSLEQPVDHRYCFRCGRSLPRHLVDLTPSKSARFFAGVKIDQYDPENAYLRVSCYRKDQTFASTEGSVVIPGNHVRFSIWVNNEAKCVLSIPETEARALSRFIEEGMERLEPAMNANAREAHRAGEF